LVKSVAAGLVYWLVSAALGLIGIPVQLNGPDLQLVHHLGLGGDLGESAASPCQLAEIARVDHGFLAIGAPSETSEAIGFAPYAARGKSPAALGESCGAFRGSSGEVVQAAQQRGQSSA